MSGADILCEALDANGVDTWFANPGTSEMHMVAALDRRPEIRCVLGLFEGVVTGAADGYARMAGKPAATLLHCGPGLANGLANLHNARRAATPMINIVGDHASYHLEYDAPLTTDIESLARPMSQWVRRVQDAETIAEDVDAACRAARGMPGVATLILPADAAWEMTRRKTLERSMEPLRQVPDAGIEMAAAHLLSGKKVMLLLSGNALRARALSLAADICARTGARMMGGVANGRVERGAGRPAIALIPYPVDLALAALADVEVLLCIGPQEPVAFFAYPGKPSRLVPEKCEVVRLAEFGDDLEACLDALATLTGAKPVFAARPVRKPEMPSSGKLTDAAVAAITARFLPEDAIICEESITSARQFWGLSSDGPNHDYLQLTGGAIGAGIPLALGASIACPDRKVICLQADGSGMYTAQGLWTQARERCNVVTIILANRSYAVLHGEMSNVGIAHPGANARRMLDLDDPAINWVSLARGMGVDAERADTVERFAVVLEAAMARNGPFLIEAVI